MKRLLMLSLALAATLAAVQFVPHDSVGQDRPRRRPSDNGVAAPIDALMHRKLENAQAILEGLALEDLESVAKNARSLKLLSMESGWNVIQTEEYATHSQQFRQAADTIQAAATAKNLQRASDGYAQLTVRCIECHSYMRAHRSRTISPDVR